MTMKTMIDLSDPVAAAKPGYVLFVLYAPGHYAPCPSVFLSDIERGATPWAMHCTALYEAVEYVEEMKHRRLIGSDSMLFIRDHEGRIVWKNEAKLAQEARYLKSLQEGDAS
jgi:hypothetical protein